MNSNDTVTVLIAAFNASPFLHRAVDSALNQTYAPLEVLIIDDASTDDTVAVARKLQEADPRIQIIELRENGGPAKARNAGLDAAKGEWIAILDADDAFLPDRLERLIQIGIKQNADLLIDNFAWYDAINKTVGSVGISTLPEIETVDIHQYVYHGRAHGNEMDWGLLKPVFRKSFLKKMSLRYPEFSRHGEDFLLMMNVFLAGACCILVRRVGHLYTQRSCGLSRTRVDYDSIAVHTAELMKDSRISSDERLKSMLRDRIKATLQLSAEYKFRTNFDKGRYAKVLYLALTNHRILIIVLRLTKRKIKSWINRF